MAKRFSEKVLAHYFLPVAPSLLTTWRLWNRPSATKMLLHFSLNLFRVKG